MITLNGTEIKPTIFPDKTSQVWKIADLYADKQNTVNLIKWNFENEGEFMHIAQLKMLLDKYNVWTRLQLDYLPYARQDKEITNESTFALRTFAKLLNSLKFDEVEILDPHSETALQLINNAADIYATPALFTAMDATPDSVFCYPDNGARSKYAYIYEHKDTVYGHKERDPATGTIKKYELVGDVKGRNVLIVDDICDGGATFIKLAALLKEAEAASINLFVTHGLFTRGLAPLRAAGIKRIFSKTGEH